MGDFPSQIIKHDSSFLQPCARDISKGNSFSYRSALTRTSFWLSALSLSVRKYLWHVRLIISCHCEDNNADVINWFKNNWAWNSLSYKKLSCHPLEKYYQNHYYYCFSCLKISRISLMVQWLRIYLSMHKAWVQSLVCKDSTCLRAAKRMRHSYWACALGPGSCNFWAHVEQRRKPVRPRAPAPRQEKPPQWEALRHIWWVALPLSTTGESPHRAVQTLTAKNKLKERFLMKDSLWFFKTILCYSS